MTSLIIQGGPGSLINLLWHIPEAPTAAWETLDAWNTAKKHYDGKISNGKGNAFLHAYLSYRLTKTLGPIIARRFTDANEVAPVAHYLRLQLTGGEPNPEKDMRADLFNNGFGRRLYVEGLAKNDQEAIEMIKEAIENGHLSVINKP